MKNDLTKLIRLKFLDAGFIRAGISKAEILNEEAVYLKIWLDEKRNADMNWMNDSLEKRSDPKLIMEDVKSIISLAYLYDTPVAHSHSKDVPKISRYAWGERDYHKVIKKILKKVCKEIEELQAGIKLRFYVDDGPVMDKVWAMKSGIGWMGKNTNVINPEFGSFFFIATILVNIELEFDKPIDDLCKSCTVCISECPTGALYDEYKLDSNLCISYQTIENRDDIPEEIDLKGWIFGCDICQDVCPFNDNNYFTDNVLFFPKTGTKEKTFNELLSLDERSFNKMYEGTPVRRTKYKGFIRNLIKSKS